MKRDLSVIVPTALVCLALATWTGCSRDPVSDTNTAAAEEHSTSAKGELQPTATSPEITKVDFNRHVRPLLSDRCFVCHGPDVDNQESPLRLDTQANSRTNLAANGEATRFAIVPGDPDASQLIIRINHTDPALRMPRIGGNRKSLTAGEKDIFRRWIKQGAKYEKHWAFVAPIKIDALTVRQSDLVRDKIDAFVLAALENKGLSLSPEADPETLIRRLYLDLTGLPPTPKAVDAFLQSKSPDTYERVVDDLLASPHYGERMAVDWLDVARFGDSNAIHVDMMRTSWPWRDWVIKAFNQNMSYKQFVIEQLAGDLLPNATLAQKVATSFNRNHGITNEGGVIPAEFLVEYAVDRVSTMSTAFMGLTVACARCHDHKFDPITMDDFYSLISFFNNIPEKGLEAQNEARALAYPPAVAVITEAQMAARTKADAMFTAVDAARKKIAEDAKTAGADASKLPEDSAVDWIPLTLLEGKMGGDKSLRGISYDKQKGNVIMKGRFGRDARLSFRFDPLTNSPINLVRIDALPNATFDYSEHGEKDHDAINILNDLTVTRMDGTDSKPMRIAAGWAADAQAGTEHAFGMAIDSDPATAWHVGLTPRPFTIFLKLSDPVPPSQAMTIHMNFSGALGAGNPFSGFKVHAGTGKDLSDDRFAAGRATPLTLIPEAKRTPQQKEELALDEYFVKTKSEYQITDWYKAQDVRNMLKQSVAKCMVMEEKPSITPTYILDRGAYDQPIKERPRPRVTPAIFPPMPSTAPSNRLGLAQWLVHEDHPLTARVAVNRYWQLIFGRGLVNTTEDFGLQGESPSHPELLDTLAVEFRESGWDVKAFMKRIVMSATYRQSSAVQDNLAAADPDNILLGRAPRYRLQAETIRDNALAASGLLVRTIGGPSTKPYQPPGLWREKTMRANMVTGVFKRDSGASLYRRGMYTFWKQAAPPPQMEIFDAPSREACVVRRRVTNTPLQALVLLNDETYAEISHSLASRLLCEIDGPWEDQLRARLTRGLRLITGRTPTPPELATWEAFTADNRARFTEKPENAETFLQYGEFRPERELPAVDVAALAFTMSAALNLDETVTRD